jgi:hypothetical protein
LNLELVKLLQDSGLMDNGAGGQGRSCLILIYQSIMNSDNATLRKEIANLRDHFALNPFIRPIPIRCERAQNGG